MELKELLKVYGLKLNDLPKHLGISKQLLNYRLKENKLTVFDLKKIVNILNLKELDCGFYPIYNIDDFVIGEEIAFFFKRGAAKQNKKEVK